MQHEFLLAHQRSQAGSVPSGAYRDDRSVLYLGCRPRGPNRARLPTLFEMEDRPPLTTDEPRKPGLQSHSRATVGARYPAYGRAFVWCEMPGMAQSGPTACCCGLRLRAGGVAPRFM